MATLFDIGNELLQVLDKIGDGGEIDNDLDQYFASIQDDEAKKLDAYVGLIRQLEAEISVAKTEEEFFYQKAKARENKIKSLKDRLKEHLERTGRQRVTSAAGRTLRVQANASSHLVVKVEDVPPEYKISKVTVEIDNERIKKELAAGQVLAFASFGERGSHLRIS
jgi:hypothetical protein